MEFINTSVSYNKGAPAHESSVKQMTETIMVCFLALMLINFLSLIIRAGKREAGKDFSEIKHNDVQRRHK